MKSQPVPPQTVSHPRESLTALSEPTTAEHPKSRHLSRVARLSLCLLVPAALGGLSCLVTTSPDFAKPVRTPPFLTNLSPAPYVIQSIRSFPTTPKSYPTLTISFEVVSEDLQSSSLQGLLWLDFQGFGSTDVPVRVGTVPKIPPGHFPSAPRDLIKAEFAFDSTVPPGCHSVTLVVTHEFDNPLALRPRPVDENDVATATWWYDVDDDGPPDLLHSCVVRGGSTGDAGTDADAGGP